MRLVQPLTATYLQAPASNADNAIQSRQWIVTWLPAQSVRNAPRRPALQPVGAVGDQQVIVLFGEFPQRAPARPRLLSRHELLQGFRAISVLLELRDQRLHFCPELLIANEIEPRHEPRPEEQDERSEGRLGGGSVAGAPE